ncbi:hypothetical protein, partial [uncultured Bacteroides sp.]|uniref:hypothetical protein n=1 Tax=uncultured Bacteroides sp. TaxID=162156 RepID=UPI00261A521C
CSVFYALFKPILAIIVGGLCRSKWVGMLRFRHLVWILTFPLYMGFLIEDKLLDVIIPDVYLKLLKKNRGRILMQNWLTIFF